MSERPKNMRSFWDRHARKDAHVAIYDSAEIRDPELREDAFEAAGKRDARSLWPFVDPGKTVVDLGCGMGRVMRELAPWSGKVIGVDISPEMIARAGEYLGEAKNCELILGNGVKLDGIEDGSVDFLYSLLCLIHVDKRSAWSYLQEAERVLKPGGLSFVQFQNILSVPGWKKFQSVAQSDYPLEFYTPDEVGEFVDRAGLEVLSLQAEAEYLYATLIKGSREEFLERFTAEVHVQLSTDGMLAVGSDGSFESGTVRWRIENDSDDARRCVFSCVLARQDEVAWRIHAGVELEPRKVVELELRLSKSVEGGDSLLIDGHEPAVCESHRVGDLAPGTYTATTGIFPPGLGLDLGIPPGWTDHCASAQIKIA
jgi:SAM-dependent methyltransferase